MKTVVKFLKTWDKYVKGDVAGFEPRVAKKLIDGKIAVQHGDGAPAVSKAAPPPASTTDPIREELDRYSRDLAAREAELQQREADLAEREKAAASSGTNDEVEKADTKKTEKGAPPAQGKT